MSYFQKYCLEDLPYIERKYAYEDPNGKVENFSDEDYGYDDYEESEDDEDVKDEDLKDEEEKSILERNSPVTKRGLSKSTGFRKNYEPTATQLSIKSNRRTRNSNKCSKTFNSTLTDFNPIDSQQPVPMNSTNIDLERTSLLSSEVSSSYEYNLQATISNDVTINNSSVFEEITSDTFEENIPFDTDFDEITFRDDTVEKPISLESDDVFDDSNIPIDTDFS